MARLSVIIITKNEAGNIGDCLRSVAFASELIVLDSGSTDDTVALAKAAGAQVHTTPDWPGFGPQKNRALNLATGDWVLSLDADERITPALKQQIENAISRDSGPVVAIPRLSSFLGQYIRHSGWQPDYVPRLFKRGSATFSNDRVHERLVFSGVAIKLTEPMLHYSFRTVDEVLDKLNSYSTARAADLSVQGKRGGLRKALLHGLWTFIRTYLLRAGFLDGRRGFILAVSNAEGTYYRYLKMSADLNDGRDPQ
jgi:glycosyltransferase involved in cell wall biosynthesis